MSLYDYKVSQSLDRKGCCGAQDIPFYALIMAAMRKADDINTNLLRQCWPDVWDELQRRYNAPGGVLPEDGMSR
jgi:hypothetical protein